MGRPLPTLGFPSRTAAVVSLYGQGLSTCEIEAVTGIPRPIIRALRRNTRPKYRARRNMDLPADLRSRLHEHALRRGVHVHVLVRLLLEACLDEGLIDAVLDDQAPP